MDINNQSSLDCLFEKLPIVSLWFCFAGVETARNYLTHIIVLSCEGLSRDNEFLTHEPTVFIVDVTSPSKRAFLWNLGATSESSLTQHSNLLLSIDWHL